LKLVGRKGKETTWGIVSRREDVLGKVEASKGGASRVVNEFRGVFIITGVEHCWFKWLGQLFPSVRFC